MNIVKKQNQSTMVLELEGRLDTMTAPELEKVVNNGLDDVKNLTMDLQKLEYVSSAGLRVMLAAQKKMNKVPDGVMTLTHVNEMVMEVFDITGFSDIFTIQ